MHFFGEPEASAARAAAGLPDPVLEQLVRKVVAQAGIAADDVAGFVEQAGLVWFGHRAEIELADSVYIVVRGKVKFGLRSSGDERPLVEILGPSDIFGELSALVPDSGGLEATCSALGEVTALRVRREDLAAWLVEHPDVAVNMQPVITRVHAAESARAQLVSTEPNIWISRTLVATLLDLGQRFGVRKGKDVLLPVKTRGRSIEAAFSQSDLAELVGTTDRDRIGLALGDFADYGWIRSEGAVLRIRHWENLAQRADVVLRLRLPLHQAMLYETGEAAIARRLTNTIIRRALSAGARLDEEGFRRDARSLMSEIAAEVVAGYRRNVEAHRRIVEAARDLLGAEHPEIAERLSAVAPDELVDAAARLPYRYQRASVQRFLEVQASQDDLDRMPLMVEMLADLTYRDPALGGRSLAQILATRPLPADEVYRRLLDAATARRPRSAEEAKEFEKAAASDPQRDVFQRAGLTATEITIAMERQAGVPDAEISWVLGRSEDELAGAGASDVGEFWRILAQLPAGQFEGYHRAITQLTPRQRELWALLLQGLSTPEIARRMGVTPQRIVVVGKDVVGRLTKAIGSTKAQGLVDAAGRGTAGELGRILGQLSPEQFHGYHATVQQLTLREREFLALRLLRLGSAEIARRIGVSQHIGLRQVEAAVIGQLTDAIESTAAHRLAGVVVDSGAAAEFGRVLAELSDEQWELYRGVIRRLNPDQQEVWALHLLGADKSQIARLMGVGQSSVSGVKALVVRQLQDNGFPATRRLMSRQPARPLPQARWHGMFWSGDPPAAADESNLKGHPDDGDRARYPSVWEQGPVPPMGDVPEMHSDVTITTVPTLLRLSHGGAESQFPFLPGDKIRLGRSTDSDLVAASTSVSREHAIIGSADDGRLWIRDNDSTDGTFVNGDRLPPNHEYLLRDGDVIRLGSDYEITALFTHSGPEPVTVRLSRGGEVAPLRLTPGSEMMLGRIAGSQLTTVFGAFERMSRNHASIGVTKDGHLWIRDNGSFNGTWINGYRIFPGRKVPLYSGDTINVGGLETTVTWEPKPAELTWIQKGRMPEEFYVTQMVVRPGSEVSLGNEASSPLPRRIAEQPGVAANHATFGVTPEGRTWVRDNGLAEGTWVNGYRLRPHEPLTLSDGDTVTLGENAPAGYIKTYSGERPPLDLRLVGRGAETAVRIPARAELKLGSAADSPLAGVPSIFPDHARIGVHPDGYVLIWVAPGATALVNGAWLLGSEPTRLRDGDVVGLGPQCEFIARFDEPVRLESERQPVVLRMGGDVEPRPINPGSDLLLGRAESSPLHELLSGDDHVSLNHASIGVHPSGRVWIRDNGSMSGTWVNGMPIASGRKIALHPGDVIRIGRFQTTVEFTAPALPDIIQLVDRSDGTNEAFEDMGLIPPAVFERIMEHLETLSTGGVTLGNRALADLPGVDGMDPFPDWAVGRYDSSRRRILVNTGAAKWLLTTLHEFGHAASHAYGDGIHWLSESPEWAAVHELVQNVRGHDPSRNTHWDTREELFAQGFASWLYGEEALLALVHGDTGAAAKLKEYYDGVFGPLE